MGLRPVPKSAFGRARLVALVSVLLVASAGALLGAGGAASAAVARPSVSYRVVGTDTVSVSGRTATASAHVRLYRHVAAGWVLVKRTTARAHRYQARLAVTAGTSSTFRVTSNHRSRRFTVTVPARTVTAAKTQYDACGARPRKADGSAWSCTFDDEFAGTALDSSKWIPQTVFATGGSTETYACYRNDPSNVNVAGGVLNLTLLKLDQPAPCGLPGYGPTPYQSGMVSTWHRFSQKYGRFEARVKNTASDYPGLGEGFWMWPDDRYGSTSPWPYSGEIDIAETFSVYPNAMASTLHYGANASSGPRYGTDYNVCAVKRGQWNVYTLEWTPTRMEFFVNGTSCFVNTAAPSDAAYQKPYIIDLTQGLGPAPMGNLPVAQTPFPATFQVDYVHVWK